MRTDDRSDRYDGVLYYIIEKDFVASNLTSLSRGRGVSRLDGAKASTESGNTVGNSVAIRSATTGR